MPVHPRPLTQQHRAALLRFERLHEEWRCAIEALAAAEHRLWSEALRAPAGTPSPLLAAETTRLRRCARAAYERLVLALREIDA